MGRINLPSGGGGNPLMGKKKRLIHNSIQGKLIFEKNRSLVGTSKEALLISHRSSENVYTIERREIEGGLYQVVQLERNHVIRAFYRDNKYYIVCGSFDGIYLLAKSSAGTLLFLKRLADDCLFAAMSNEMIYIISKKQALKFSINGLLIKSITIRDPSSTEYTFSSEIITETEEMVSYNDAAIDFKNGNVSKIYHGSNIIKGKESYLDNVLNLRTFFEKSTRVRVSFLKKIKDIYVCFLEIGIENRSFICSVVLIDDRDISNYDIKINHLTSFNNLYFPDFFDIFENNVLIYNGNDGVYFMSI